MTLQEETPSAPHAPSGDALVVLDQVDKWYGDLHVLQDINLQVTRGEVVVVIGPSGSGKSTLCRTINRLETIDKGSISLDGQPQGLDEDPEGFDVEVAKIIAGALGLDPEADIAYSEAPSEVREQVIEDGDVDMVVATYTINDERKERITFAGPYYEAGQMLMVAEDNEVITAPEDLADNPDQQVCSVNGSTPSENIREYLASDAQLTLFDDYSLCVDALGNGQVDVVTTDNVILLGYVSESDGASKLVGEQFTEEPYGIGIEKGDVEFCEFINETLAENEDAYLDAWARTAGEVEGTETPELPEADTCS